MQMTIENTETIRIDGYSTFVVGFDDKTVELFAVAFGAAFANHVPADIYDMIALVGNATEDTNTAIEQGYLTEACRIDEIISLINQYADFDDDNNEHETAEDTCLAVSIECSEDMKKFEKTLDHAANSAMMGTWEANKHSNQPRSSTMNVKKTLETVVVWYNKDTNKVSLAKCRVTGKFVSHAIAQGLLNVELVQFRLPTVDTVELDYSFLAMLAFVVATMLALGVTTLVIGLAVHASAIVAALYALLIPAFAGLAAISIEESIEIRMA